MAVAVRPSQGVIYYFDPFSTDPPWSVKDEKRLGYRSLSIKTLPYDKQPVGTTSCGWRCLNWLLAFADGTAFEPF